MFGLIVSGRLVQTDGDFQRVSQTQLLVNIADADNINHIVVFLTGTEPFPDGTGGSVYFSWPDPNAPPTWQLLGYISNNKPSAIFKISKLKTDRSSNNPFSFQSSSHTAQIGISVEPLTQIELQTPAISANHHNVDSHMEFCTKMLENFYNYASSFAQPQCRMNPTETTVPLSTLQNWFNNFQRRLQLNPTFWKN